MQKLDEKQSVYSPEIVTLLKTFQLIVMAVRYNNWARKVGIYLYLRHSLTSTNLIWEVRTKLLTLLKASGSGVNFQKCNLE